MLAWSLPRKPGAAISSVHRQPPISCLLSNMPTLMPPYFIRYRASNKPLFPPPTITATNVASAIMTPFQTVFAFEISNLKLNYAAYNPALFERLKRLIDLVQGIGFGYQLINGEFASHVQVDVSRYINLWIYIALNSASDGLTQQKFICSDAERSAKRCHAHDDELASQANRGERLRHNIHVSNALQSIIRTTACYLYNFSHWVVSRCVD